MSNLEQLIKKLSKQQTNVLFEELQTKALEI